MSWDLVDDLMFGCRGLGQMSWGLVDDFAVVEAYPRS